MGEQSPQGHVIFKSHAIPYGLAGRVTVGRDLCPVIIGYIHKILEKGLDVHGIHPFLAQPY